jgi:DNA mismatch repair protein MutL
MPKIKHLPTHEAQKIAAGQVIERPADIIKELIENSIDAQATAITLYVEDAGKQLIRVVDNGCGMDSDDAQLCFEKHATSKIRSMDELQNISTFGFRGEAMPSIAAVCKVTLITKQQDAPEGLLVTIQNNVIQQCEPISASVGTDISAADLFFNIPARKKFLKKNDTELRHITQLFHAFCLVYPHIHFKFFSDNKQTLNCPPVHTISDRCTQLWQNIPAQHMLSLNAQDKNDSLHITGAISDHQNFRFDRSSIFLFVNNRWIKDFKLSNAFIKGYMNVAPQGRYPMGCLAITIDPKLVDINVHPRKEEVRFLNPRVVEQLIQQSVKTCLEENIAKRIPIKKNTFDFASSLLHQDEGQVSMSKFYTHVTPTSYSAHNQTMYKPFNFDAVFPEPQAWSATNTSLSQELQAYPSTGSGRTACNKDEKKLKNTISNPIVRPEPVEGTAMENNQINISNDTSTNTESSYTLIGQYHKTYILIEQKDGLFIIDQHAAHERILYELFAYRFTDVAIVQLLFPIVIMLSNNDIQIIEPYLSLFIENGITIELFGLNQLKVQATPVHLKDVSLEDLIKEAIGWINEYKYLDEQQFIKKLHEKLRAQMACKAAVKAGDILSHAHMQQLLTTLHTTENRLTCPHGRPTGWLLSNHEIEKKFKRKL